MRIARLAAIGLSVALGSGALGIGARADTVAPVPAEAPPADFAAREFVDSAGCVFQRAGVSGTTVWVPRIGTDHNQVCGRQPSIAPPQQVVVAGAGKAAGQAADAAAGQAAPVAPAVEDAAAKPAAKASPKAARRLARGSNPGAGPQRLAGSLTVPAAATRCPHAGGSAERYYLTDGLRVTKCGPKAADGLAFLNGLGAPGVHPVADAAGRSVTDAARYRLVWSNAPLRPRQGNLPPSRWVQIGAFVEPDNRKAAIAAVHSIGLPAAHQVLERGARPLVAVLAGPFATPDALADALARLRAEGFTEAFARD